MSPETNEDDSIAQDLRIVDADYMPWAKTLQLGHALSRVESALRHLFSDQTGRFNWATRSRAWKGLI